MYANCREWFDLHATSQPVSGQPDHISSADADWNGTYRISFTNLQFDDTVWSDDFEDNGFSAIVKIGSTQVATIPHITVTHQTIGDNRWIATTQDYYEFTVSSSVTNEPITVEFNYYNDPTCNADVLDGSGFTVSGVRTAEFEYDHHNRLVHYDEYSDESGTLLQSIDYIYDVFGQLIGRKLDLPAAGDQFEYYVNDRGQRVFTVEPDDIANPTDHRVTTRKLWDQAVDQLLASEAYDYDSGHHETYWPLTDHQGTVRHVYSIAGYTDKAEHTEYDAFGRPNLVESSTDGTAEWYVDSFQAGREYDEYTGLYYNRARWYDPESGRFLSEDPLGFAGSDLNLYRYVGNSPINATDPSGCVANVVVGAGIGGVLGAGAYLYQYATGSVEEFSWTDLGIYTAGGMAAGAVAGATFGLSLAAGGTVAGAFGLSGTTAAVTTASVTLGLTGTAAGATGGLVVGAGMTASHGESAGQIAMGGLAGAGRGAFYGGVSGAAAGAILPFAATTVTSAGLTGWFGGGLAMGGSFAFGDATAQGMGNVFGLQQGYNPYQTLFVGATAFMGGAYVGSRDTAIAAALGRPGYALATFKSGFRTLIPEVTAEATVGGRVFSDVNPLARLGSVEKPTLIAGRVATKIKAGGQPHPNGSMGTAHAEIGSIQQAAEAGVTRGADMVLRVTGKNVCGYCVGDIPAAAQAAGLRSLLVIEQATGRQARWTPGTRSLKFQ